MRKTACNQICIEQMLTPTRFYSKDIFDSGKQVVSSLNKKLTETKD